MDVTIRGSKLYVTGADILRAVEESAGYEEFDEAIKEVCNSGTSGLFSYNNLVSFAAEVEPEDEAMITIIPKKKLRKFEIKTEDTEGSVWETEVEMTF